MKRNDITIPADLADYISKQTPNMAAHMTEVVTTYLRHRKQLIETIVANESNVFTLDELNEMETDILEGTAALAGTPDVPWFKGHPRFGGQG